MVTYDNPCALSVLTGNYTCHCFVTNMIKSRPVDSTRVSNHDLRNVTAPISNDFTLYVKMCASLFTFTSSTFVEHESQRLVVSIISANWR